MPAELTQAMIDFLKAALTELVRYGDGPAILITAWIASVLRRYIETNARLTRWFGGDRYVGFVLLLGAVIGLLWDFSTPQAFKWRLAIRKMIVAGGGAAAAYKVLRSSSPAWFGDLKNGAPPPASA